MLDKSNINIIELELTTLCNADCPLCYRNYKAFKSHYPKTISRPIDEVINQLNEYPNLNEIRLVGSISEPTLYDKFFELVKYIVNRNIKIEICTNGDTNNPKWWKELGNILKKTDDVFFSICGSTQELHNIYRKGTKLKNILVNAEAFRSSGNQNDFAQCIRFEYNDENFNSKDFKDTISVFSNIYWTETFLSKDPNIYINTLNLDKLNPMKSKQDKYYKMDKFSKVLFERGKSETICQSINEKSIQLDINGNIYPCYLFLEASKGEKWDQDYDSIKKSKDEVCRFCQEHVYNYCLSNNMLAIT